MESYLKEKDPVEEDKQIDIEKLIVEFDEDYRKRFSNLIYAQSVTSYYPDFKKVIHLPNNNKEMKSIDSVLKKYIESCTDNLEYYLSVKIDVDINTINIFVVPIVESA
jgi:hypothetical protein